MYGKKQFLDENDVKIGKGLVEEMFEKDRERLAESLLYRRFVKQLSN